MASHTGRGSSLPLLSPLRIRAEEGHRRAARRGSWLVQHAERNSERARGTARAFARAPSIPASRRLELQEVLFHTSQPVAVPPSRQTAGASEADGR